jgi:NAD(P)-dependent dehydrogenase (short-subunit alcohol dehydrogenase family)
MAHELAGQVAIVTGSGRGIGQAIAEGLSAAGAAVTVTARSREQVNATVAGITAAGGRAIGVVADITDRSAVWRLVEQTERQLGPVNLLVNNAGASAAVGPFWEADPDEWWQVVEINLRGVMLPTRAVLPGMIARHRGRIINVASNSAVRPSRWNSSYSASKAAVLRLTDSLALTTTEHGVYTFAISPGDVRTAMTEHTWQSTQTGEWPSWMKEPPKMVDGDWLPPQRTAELCVLLASGAADVLSGRYIHVSDDVAELLAHAEQIERDGLYALRLPKLHGLV